MKSNPISCKSGLSITSLNLSASSVGCGAQFLILFTVFLRDMLFRPLHHLVCDLSTVGVLSTVEDILSTVGDIIFCCLSTLGGYHDTCGPYHEYRGGV